MHVLLADPIPTAGTDLLARNHHVDVTTGLATDELVALAGDHDAIVVRSQTTIGADVLAAEHTLALLLELARNIA